MFDEFRWTRISEKRNDLTSLYEPIQIDLLRSLAKRCSRAIFLDIGANIGVYSIMLSSEESIIEIHAFEPLASLSSEIRKNLALNNLSDLVKVHQVVLSDKAGTAEFVIRSDYAGDGGVFATHQSAHLPYDRMEQLQRCTLDEMLRIRERYFVAKIDVEGHELNVLHGAKEILQTNKGFLQVELLTENSLKTTGNFLASLGWYCLFKVDHDVYFTNIGGLDSAKMRLELLENGLKQFVDRTRSGAGSPARKRIFPGIRFEVRRSYIRRIKGLFRRKLKYKGS